MKAILRTSRLQLREFTTDDVDVLAAMWDDPDQMRFYPRTRTEDEAVEWIDRNLALYESHGFGFWLVEDAHSSDFLGYAGIRPLMIEGIEEIEMGWHTVKHVWNQGVATDSAIACRGLAFDRFDIDRLVATIDPSHDASVRVAAKIGMRQEKETMLDGWPCVVYSIDRGPDADLC